MLLSLILLLDNSLYHLNLPFDDLGLACLLLQSLLNLLDSLTVLFPFAIYLNYLAHKLLLECVHLVSEVLHLGGRSFLEFLGCKPERLD